MTRNRWIASRVGLVALALGATAGQALADDYTFEEAQYIAGASVEGVQHAPGAPVGMSWTWRKVNTPGIPAGNVGRTRDFFVDDAYFSPLALDGTTVVSSGKSIRATADNVAAPANEAHLGIDLVNPVASGVFLLQFDVKSSAHTGGNQLLRVQPQRTFGYDGTNDPPPGSAIVVQPYAQAGGGPNWGANGFMGLPLGGGLTAANWFGTENVANNTALPSGFPNGTAANDRWYRWKLWFNLDGPNAGQWLYGAIYDINCGSEIQVGEASDFEGNIIGFAGGGAMEVRSLSLRMGGIGGQSWWLDNVRLAQTSLGNVPTPIDGPTSTPPANRPNASQTGTVEWTWPLFPPGSMTSIAYDPGSGYVYTYDSANGLNRRVDTATPGTSPTNVNDGSYFDTTFSAESTGVLSVFEPGTGSSDPTLVVLGSSPGDPDAFGSAFRNLTRYNFGTNDWTILASAFGSTGVPGITNGQTGDQAITTINFNGDKRTLWCGNGFNAIGGMGNDGFGGVYGPNIANIGFWGTATCPTVAPGSYSSDLFFLRQSDASGRAIGAAPAASPSYRTIYRTVSFSLGCTPSDNISLSARVSPAGNPLPWALNASDGGGVNRHVMQFVPGAGAQGRIWVLRAGGTNNVGIYDLATDTWAVVQLFKDDGVTPLTIVRGDLELVGNRMYIIVAGDQNVYSFNALIDGTPIIPPANDLCGGATGVSEGTHALNTTLATTSGPLETLCVNFDDGAVYNDVWFLYNPSASGTATISTCGGVTFDTKIAVYGATCPTGPDTALDCNDDAGGACGAQSTVTLAVNGALNYLIRIGGYGPGDLGAGTFTISLTPSGCPADFNTSGAVTVQDIYDFLADWNSQVSGGPIIIASADFNGVGGVTVQDIYDFLAAWNAAVTFPPCGP